jgi:Plavaka transposase
VSVATGQNEYYPLYMSNGLVWNNVRRAHRNALTLISFLAIPKSKSTTFEYYSIYLVDSLLRHLADKEHADSVEFRKFRRNLFHSSLSKILQPLCPGMEKPQVLRYSDGHYRRTIYGLGPYIADYPEQVLLACIVQGWCPRYCQFSVLLMTIL